MRPVLEFGAFLGVAVAAHVAVWPMLPPVGAEASGEGGAAQVSLLASPEALAALAEEWRQSPDALAEIVAPAPPMAEPAPPRPQLERMVAPVAASSLSVPDDPGQAPERPARMPVPRVAALEPVLALPTPPDVPEIPDTEASRGAPSRPVALATSPSPMAPPVADVAPPPAPVSEAAPLVSLRPAMRPERPAPQPVRSAQQQAAALEPPAPRQQAEASTPTPAQRAQGQGGGSSAGANAPASASATLSASARQSLMAEWGGAIRASVERRKRYPGGTRASGRVVLSVAVATDGRLAGVGIAHSSGHAALDRAAVQAVQRARIPRAPGGLGPGPHRFNLPMSFAP